MEEMIKNIASKWGEDVYAYVPSDVIKADRRAQGFEHFYSLLFYYQNLRANYIAEE